VITGAAGDIGSAVAERLASEGASVLLVDIRKGPLDEVAKRVSATAEAAGAGGRVETCLADVTKKDEVEAYVAQGEAMGGIDCFFNNAGEAPRADLGRRACGRPLAGLGGGAEARWHEASGPTGHPCSCGRSNGCSRAGTGAFHAGKFARWRPLAPTASHS